MARPWPNRRGAPAAGGYGSGYGEQPHHHDIDPPRQCEHCLIPLRGAPAWWRLCPRCFKIEQAGRAIRKAAELLNAAGIVPPRRWR
jgi:hypothetical protein